MRKIRICHIEITPIDLMPRVWRAANAAKEAGYNVTVIGFGESVDYNGIRYIGVGTPRSRLERMLKMSKDMVDLALDSDADIIELHSPELLRYYKKIKAKGRKVLFNSHEFYGIQILHKAYIPPIFRRPISKFYRLFEKNICRKIDGVIYPCTVKGKNLFDDRRIKSIKIENYSDQIGEIQEGKKEERSAIYAGSLSAKRGITTLIKVFEKIDGILYLVGEFESEEYRSYITSISDPNKVKYLGILSREKLFRVYSTVCVGLSVLKKTGQYGLTDNMSTKIYEYMQCGIPVVCSASDYLDKVNEEYRFGITVDPDNLEDIGRAIERLFDDADLARELGNNGKKAIEEKYNWRKEKIKLQKFYRELL